MAPVPLAAAPARGTRVVLHLMEDAKSFTERFTLERIVREQSGHVRVPISVIEKPGAEPTEVADGIALWTKPKAEVTAADYTDLYRGLGGLFDEPALTVHFAPRGATNTPRSPSFLAPGSLVKSYGPGRVEAACRRGNNIGATTYGSIASILKTGLDRAYAEHDGFTRKGTDEAPFHHENIRGRDYYH